MTTKQALARFEREYIAYHRISDERKREQVKLLLEFADTLGKGRSLDQAKASDLMAFAGALIGRGFHVNTVRKKLNMIRAFVSWAYGAGVYDADTYLKLRAVPNPRGSSGVSKPHPYKRTEIAQFWADVARALPYIPASGKGSRALEGWVAGRGRWAPLRSHAMRLQIECAVRLALDLGLRRNEIYGLTLDDMHYDNQYMVIRGKADPNTGAPKIREVPITEHAREAIKAWVEFRTVLRADHNSPWLFLWRKSEHNLAMTERTFATLLQDRVGQPWAWHRFRHTCATERLRNGMPLESVKTLLGHATIQQTLAYAEIAKGDIGKQMEGQADEFNAAVGRAA